MGTVSVRVPDELKERMEEHDDVNWSAVLRGHIEEELSERESRNVARAVAVSERLSRQVGDDAAGENQAVETIREWRDRRRGGDQR